MQARLDLRMLVLGGAVFILAACEPGVVSKNAGFQRSYSISRKALEAGNYDMAIKGYGAMIAGSGPLEPRLRLEYAHALLRAERYGEAARISGALANSLKGSDRAAALAVQGTAEHEMALTAMASGNYGAGTKAHLLAARSALDEMLKIDPDLDPLGAMASRRKDIGSELKDVRKRA